MELRRPSELTEADLPVTCRPVCDFAAVKPLLALCEGGKLYEVEAWIAEGRPLQFPPPDDRKLQRRSTALQIAVARHFFSLAALLLANGYDPNGDYYECLSPAVRSKDHDMVDLLLRFGADPTVVDFCTVLETCDRTIMDRFVAAGVDPCRDNAVARSLYFKGRPILGFIRQYRDRFPCLQRQIDIALHVFTEKTDLRGIALMLWLGADPHAETPSSAEPDPSYSGVGSTAFKSAIWRQNPEVFASFLKRPIPKAKIDELLHYVGYRGHPELVRRLLAEGANPNSISDEGNPVLRSFIKAPLWRYTPRTSEEQAASLEALEIILKAGAKWSPGEQQLKWLRRDLAAGESRVVQRVVELLRQYEAFTATQMHELTRTPAVKKVLNGFTKPYRDPFTNLYTPVPVAPPMAPVEPQRRGYWKRHWSQR